MALRADYDYQIQIEKVLKAFDALLEASIKEKGFRSTLKSLTNRRTHVILDVNDGVAEMTDTGVYDVALQTSDGPLMFIGAKSTPSHRSVSQSLLSTTKPERHSVDSDALTSNQLVEQLVRDGKDSAPRLIGLIELTRFDTAQRDVILPRLWNYILTHRNSNDPKQSAAVGAAIRKYVAIMPMNELEKLSQLLETGQRSDVPIEVEIEIGKMISRNCAVQPPPSQDAYPELSARLLEIVEDYMGPRVLPKGKYSAAALICIEALFALRSSLAIQAAEKVRACPYKWFSEMVADNLELLRNSWKAKNVEAADWLETIRVTTLKLSVT